MTQNETLSDFQSDRRQQAMRASFRADLGLVLSTGWRRSLGRSVMSLLERFGEKSAIFLRPAVETAIYLDGDDVCIRQEGESEDDFVMIDISQVDALILALLAIKAKANS
jgi:hypothetical protein